MYIYTFTFRQNKNANFVYSVLENLNDGGTISERALLPV